MFWIVYESTGKYPESLFGSYNLHAVGLFDECLAVRPPEPHNFVGRYCTVHLVPRNLNKTKHLIGNENSTRTSDLNDRGSWINLIELIQLLLSSGETIEPIVGDPDPMVLSQPSMGFCIPSSCSSLDLRTAVSEIVGSAALGNLAIATITDNHLCFADTDAQPPFDGPAIAMMWECYLNLPLMYDLSLIFSFNLFSIVLSVLGTLVVTATVHEAIRFYLKKPVDASKSSGPVKALHCFSALNNGRKILSTESPSGSFTCLHGIRVLSTTWVILGHFWGLSLSWTINLSQAFQVFSRKQSYSLT